MALEESGKINVVPVSKTRGRRRLRWAGIAILILATIVIIWRIKIRHEINSRLAAIRAAGLPTNWEELSKWPKEVPNSENAAFIYTNAIAHIRPNTIPYIPYNEPLLPLRNEDIPEALRAAGEAAVRTNRVALEIAYTAKGFSKSRYPVNYSDRSFAKLSHLSGLNSLRKLLELEAYIQAEAGNSVDAAKAVQASLDLARSLENEPILLSQFVAASVLTKSCQSLESVLYRIPVSEEALRQLAEQVAAADATNRLLTGLIGERALSTELLRQEKEDVRKFGKEGNPDPDKTDWREGSLDFLWDAFGLSDRDRAFLLRAMDTNIAIAAISLPAALNMTNQIESMKARAFKGWYAYSALVLMSLGRPTEEKARTHAYVRTALIAVAIERWRLAHGGELPNSLDVLVPAFLQSVPIDPYDGQPVRFKRLARGYVVYSVGPNRVDDGGKEKPPRKAKISDSERNRYDITFTVER